MNFTTNLISLLLLVMSSSGPAIINTIEPIVLDKYPNFLLVHFVHHYSPQVVLFSTGLMYYVKNPALRTFAWVEASNRCQLLWQKIKSIAT